MPGKFVTTLRKFVGAVIRNLLPKESTPSFKKGYANEYRKIECANLQVGRASCREKALYYILVGRTGNLQFLCIIHGARKGGSE